MISGSVLPFKKKESVLSLVSDKGRFNTKVFGKATMFVKRRSTFGLQGMSGCVIPLKIT